MTTADYLNQLEQDRQDLVDNLETKGITGLSGDETFTELVPEVLNIPSGSNLSDYFSSSVSLPSYSYSSYGVAKLIIKKLPTFTFSSTNLSYAFANMELLEEVPLIDTSNVSNMSYCFTNCKKLTTLPLLNFSKLTNAERMCEGCTSLISVPQFNTEKLQNVSQMFRSCNSLTTIPKMDFSKVTSFSYFIYLSHNLNDASLDNILKMCAEATLYTGTKTFFTLLGNNNSSKTYYPASRIQALPSYQDFIDAGWTIGY